MFVLKMFNSVGSWQLAVVSRQSSVVSRQSSVSDLTINDHQ